MKHLLLLLPVLCLSSCGDPVKTADSKLSPEAQVATVWADAAVKIAGAAALGAVGYSFFKHQ